MTLSLQSVYSHIHQWSWPVFHKERPQSLLQNNDVHIMKSQVKILTRLTNNWNIAVYCIRPEIQCACCTFSWAQDSFWGGSRSSALGLGVTLFLSYNEEGNISSQMIPETDLLFLSTFFFFLLAATLWFNAMCHYWPTPAAATARWVEVKNFIAICAHSSSTAEFLVQS